MTPVVLMAGGRGLRLHPLTETHPKPLLHVGGKPILEQIMDGFAAQGFRKFWLCVNYKAELIEAHFGNGQGRNIKIRYIHESEPLGTGGALRLLPTFENPFIVCNADILTKVSYGRLMEHHARANAQATVCLALHQYQVPYGVAEFNGADADSLIGISEKPVLSALVNAGIYVLDPEALEHAPEGAFDMPDLIGKLDRLAHYPIEDFWIDVGRFEDLARANGEWSA